MQWIVYQTDSNEIYLHFVKCVFILIKINIDGTSDRWQQQQGKHLFQIHFNYSNVFEYIYIYIPRNIYSFLSSVFYLNGPMLTSIIYTFVAEQNNSYSLLFINSNLLFTLLKLKQKETTYSLEQFRSKRNKKKK